MYVGRESFDERNATKHVGKRAEERDGAGDSGRVKEGLKEIEEKVPNFACRFGSDSIV